MSLRWYRRPRLVVLNLATTALDAARAIEKNNIGAVVVQEQGRAVGIVTDRDLTIRVVGQGLDPKTTPLSEVMTAPVMTLAPTDAQSDAIRLMEERGIRRIPLVESDRFVGIVTLDDLVLDEGASLDQLAAVVESQIGEGGPATPVRSPGIQRRAARAEASYRRLLNQLHEHAGLESLEETETALEIVLNALVRRLTAGEAKDLIAQLPSLLQAKLRVLPPGPDKLITRESIETELAQQFSLDRTRAAQLLMTIGVTVAGSISAGQMKDVQGQLPETLRAVFSDSRAAAS
jgi:CBS domain-containing protein/uncharacterized protein (DUF2267 family)